MQLKGQSFLVQLFNTLSQCGMRQKLISAFAFQPPKISYIMRSINRKQKKDKVSPTKSEKYTDIENIRVHKISFETFDEHSLARKKDQISTFFLPDLNLIESSHKGSRFQTSKLFIENDEVKNKAFLNCSTEIIYEQHYKPKNSRFTAIFNIHRKYPLHQIYLLDFNNQQIDVGIQENLNINGYFLQSRKGAQIASLFIEIQKTKVDYCLIFSHGNAADLGYMLDTYLDLAYNLNINVFAYEYSGYGQSTGHCSDISIIQDIKSAYKFLTEELGFQSTKLIVYGYSIGSGPSVALTSLPQYPVGGLIIHSGISSGMRVVNMKLKETPFYDFFPNVDLIKNVQCPVFILHGTNDLFIGIQHAKMLAQNCERLHQLWSVKNAGHFGIDTEIQYRKEYFEKMKDFVKSIIQDNQLIPKSELVRRNTAKVRNNQNHYYSGRIDTISFNGDQEISNRISILQPPERKMDKNFELQESLTQMPP